MERPFRGVFAATRVLVAVDSESDSASGSPSYVLVGMSTSWWVVFFDLEPVRD